LAVLIEGIQGIKVHKLTTFASVGAGKSLNNLFKKEILSNRALPFNLEVVRHGGGTNTELDFIPVLGGVHLGEGASSDKCQVKVYYTQPNKSKPWINPVSVSIFAIFLNLFSSFGSSHVRQTTLLDFTWKKIEDKSEVDAHLRLGNKLEPLRKCIAFILNVFTLFILNGQSMTSYFYANKNKKTPVKANLTPNFNLQ
jgi:hypothetical protein